MPDYTVLENPKTNLATEVLSSDGQLLGKYYYRDNRTLLDYKQISPNLVLKLWDFFYSNVLFWWLKAKLKRDWWTCQACFLGRNLNFQLSTATIDLWQMTALEKCCWSTQNNHHFHQGRGLVFWRTHLGM